MSRPAGFKIRHWSDAEVEILKRMKAEKRREADIASALDRTQMAVKGKWSYVSEAP